MVNVHLPNFTEGLKCLVDSGAKHNRFHADFAVAAGIDLSDPDEVDTFNAGGRRYTDCPVVRVQLSIGPLQWEAPVCFVENWDSDFQLLGHEGFFRYFKVCFLAADERLSIDEIDH